MIPARGNRRARAWRAIALLVPTLVLVASAGCADPSRAVSVNAYRNAVSLGISARLADAGITIRERPRCDIDQDDQVRAGGTFRTTCTSSTTDGKSVVARGTMSGAGTPEQREHYVIHVAGRAVADASCLGPRCASVSAGPGS